VSALGTVTALQLDAGHVGMVVGRRARDLLWEPLADFLGGA
jgi:polyhydroxyalkanoate synthase